MFPWPATFGLEAARSSLAVEKKNGSDGRFSRDLLHDFLNPGDIRGSSGFRPDTCLYGSNNDESLPEKGILGPVPIPADIPVSGNRDHDEEGENGRHDNHSRQVKRFIGPSLFHSQSFTTIPEESNVSLL